MKPYIVLSTEPWRSTPTRTQQLTTRLRDGEVLFFEPFHGNGPGHKAPGRRVRPNVTVYTLPPVRPLPEQAELLRRCPLYQKLWQAHLGTQGWAVTSGAKEGQ